MRDGGEDIGAVGSRSLDTVSTRQLDSNVKGGRAYRW
jgi:hypothetical protein